jgi:putative ubiquitin-RnfH superfamily antitoxin RatB of RatAB toxin-antitoxin module/catechol 2,3-dioxygenase-like lactoylglutathione lyase family enzyme
MTAGNDRPMLRVSVAFATAKKNFWRYLDCPEGATALDAINESGVLAEFPTIDLATNKVGIFGTIATVDTALKDGDRVEIYRPITIDPARLPKRKYRLRPVEPLIESAGKLRTLKVPDEKLLRDKEDDVSLAGLLCEYGFVVKVDVTDLERSLAWYEEKLGFKLDDNHSAGSWRQLTLDALPNTALGLFLNPDGAGLGGKKATFVVTNINAVREALVSDGVDVDEVVQLGEWVKLAFLRDPDGNVFGIRENVVH